jgi:hypothetical protein
MRLVAIYRKNSDHARPVYDFIEMLRRRYPDKRIEELEVDSRDGAAEATLYGVTQYPAMIATSLDGSVLGMWEGLPLPLIDEVAGLLLEQQGPTV